ncbi:peptidylprolyl isomerase [Agromyces flavus]|uniref:peptidylprolyl isomerase n=1 Tax=Agromyces flavus TaxID=589382 RepID=A0A1H1ZU75_9MICO|nr:FKBP-type peptidyl-prolyl cis-trans isomerase [Agromyces flavus]MCP2367278.1 peptidylprolyl isomerase [Agromyces flavus]GGI46048.1 peptidylprolyl isomerase [Agromyces flavus]SDT37345.1 FKBP-type peptidyl-prolyl cis-trans isomerase [Agromyces flavus]
MNRALRRGAPIALVSLTALLLAGCAGSGTSPESTPEATDEAAACLEVEAGEQSDAVEVEGDFGAAPTATFETPLEADELQRTIAIEGDGDDTVSGDEVSAVVTAFKGSDGTQVFSQPASLTVGDGSLYEGFLAGVDCVPIGSRVVTVAPASSVYGDQGNEGIGVAAGETLVIVTDVQDIVEAEDLPTPGEWTENVPEVEFNGEEPPTVTIPDAEPSDELLVKVLEEGDGAEVQAGDTVTLYYQGLNWATKEIFDQSYGKDSGYGQNAAQFGTADVIPGFGGALVGQKVGTKLIVTIPPALGYGEEESANGLGGQTLVFVVEIQDTKGAGSE